MSSQKRYSTLLLLYAAQQIPIAFFTTALPVIFRQEGVSLTVISLLQLLRIPFVVKFLWAPLVDRHGPNNGHYRAWIIGMESLYALALLPIAFLDIHASYYMLMSMLLLAAVFASTQDIAVDALAARMLRFRERGIGNGIQSAGSFLGYFLGGGIILLIYNAAGWKNIILTLSIIVAAPIIRMMFFVESRRDAPIELRSSFSDVISFFRQKNIGRWSAILLTYFGVLMGVEVMARPLLVDIGYSLETIAGINGILSPAIGVAASFLGGWIVKRYSRKHVFLLFGFCNIVGALLYVAVANGFSSLPWVIGVASAKSIFYAWSSVILYTGAMDYCRPEKEGLDFTLQMSVAYLGAMAIASISGAIADIYGYTSLFLLEAVLGLCVLAVVAGEKFKEA